MQKVREHWFVCCVAMLSIVWQVEGMLISIYVKTASFRTENWRFGTEYQIDSTL